MASLKKLWAQIKLVFYSELLSKVTDTSNFYKIESSKKMCTRNVLLTRSYALDIILYQKNHRISIDFVVLYSFWLVYKNLDCSMKIDK